MFIYPARLTPDDDAGGYVVTFRDVPEAITQGESQEDALAEAADALEEAIAGYMDDGRELPNGSKPNKGEHCVVLPAQTAVKGALYLAMRETATSRVELARRLETDEKAVRRMLDPHHGTKLATMERALAALGKRLEVSVA